MAKPGSGAPPPPSDAEPLLLHHSPPSYGIPIPNYQPPPPPAPVDPYIILLPFHRRRRHPRRGLSSSSLLAILSSVVFLFAAIVLLWPSNPEIRISRLHLHSIHISTSKRGGVTLDFDLDLKIRVENRDFYSLDYGEITVGIGYRGRSLGSLQASGGNLRAKGVSYVDAKLRLSGIRILEDAIFLIEDLARGSVQFDSSTELLGGELHFFGIDLPIQGRVSCSINVDLAKQTITGQDCYPD